MKYLRLLALALALILGVAACGTASDVSDVDLDEPELEGDLIPDDYGFGAPDSIRIFNNVDDHPTIVRVCLDGVAFRTISTTHQNLASGAVERVPEWDALCEGLR